MAEDKIRMCGKIIAVLQVKQGVTAKGEWASQEYVLETNEQYPKKVCFEVFGKDRIQKNALLIGDEVEIMVNIDAREFNGRWYNTVRAWSVKRLNVSQDTTAVNIPKQNNTPKEETKPMDVSDLPF